jgi:hypothetical protein
VNLGCPAHRIKMQNPARTADPAYLVRASELGSGERTVEPILHPLPWTRHTARPSRDGPYLNLSLIAWYNVLIYGWLRPQAMQQLECYWQVGAISTAHLPPYPTNRPVWVQWYGARLWHHEDALVKVDVTWCSIQAHGLWSTEPRRWRMGCNSALRGAAYRAQMIGWSATQWWKQTTQQRYPTLCDLALKV